MGPAITISAGFVSLRAKCPYRDRVVLCASIFALRDRKSTRLNSSHGYISYAVFCLKKKKNKLNLKLPFVAFFRPLSIQSFLRHQSSILMLYHLVLQMLTICLCCVNQATHGMCYSYS